MAALPDSAESSKRLVDCGKELSDQNDYAGSRRIFERAIEMARRRADRSSLASALYGYGGVLIAVGEGDRAEPLLVENGRISEEIGDKNGMAEASSALGRLRNMQARYDEARVFHMRSFELWNEIGDELGIAIALNNVGQMYLAVGDYVMALDYYQRSLDGLERLGDRRRSATVLDNMGVIARRLGDYGRGLELAQRALDIRESFQDRVGIAKSFDSLSQVYQAQGNYGAALAALGKSLDLRRAIGRVHATAEALNNIAVVYEAQGSYEQAVKYLRQSLALNDAKVGDKSLGAEIHTHLGELFLLQGQLTRATQSLKRSLAISETSDFKPEAADARYVLGRVYIALRQFGAAQATLEKCLAFRDAVGDRRGRADVLIEMAELDRRRCRLQNGLGSGAGSRAACRPDGIAGRPVAGADAHWTAAARTVAPIRRARGLRRRDRAHRGAAFAESRRRGDAEPLLRRPPRALPGADRARSRRVEHGRRAVLCGALEGARAPRCRPRRRRPRHQGDDRGGTYAGARAPHLVELRQQRARPGRAGGVARRDASVGPEAKTRVETPGLRGVSIPVVRGASRSE